MMSNEYLSEELPEKWEREPEKPCFKKRPYQRRVFSTKLRKKIMQQFRIGRVTEPQKDVAMSKTYRTEILDRLCDMCDCEFCDIVKWLKANWAAVLQILLSEFKIYTPQEGYRYPAGGDPFDNDHYREDRDAT
jgi:hypothetical protein